MFKIVSKPARPPESKEERQIRLMNDLCDFLVNEKGGRNRIDHWGEDNTILGIPIKEDK